MAENTENWTKLESDSRYPRRYEFEELETKVDDFQPLQSFTYKDTVADYSALSSLTGLEVGDGYVNADDGLVYVWNGTSFPAEGGGMDVSMKPIGVVEDGNEFAVSGGEVYNKFSIEKEGAYINIYDHSNYMEGWAFNSITLKPTLQPELSRANFALSNWVDNVAGKTLRIRRSDGGLISKLVVGYETKTSDGIRISEPLDDKIAELIITVPSNINHILIYIKYVSQSIDFNNNLLLVEEFKDDAINIKIKDENVTDLEIIENNKNKIQDYAGNIIIEEGTDVFKTEGQQINKTLTSPTNWNIIDSPTNVDDLSAFIPLVEGRKYIVRRKDGGDMKPSMVTYDDDFLPLRRLFSVEEYPNATTFVKEAIFTANKGEAYLVVYTRYRSQLNPININDLVEVLEYDSDIEATIKVSENDIKISDIIDFQSEKIKSLIKAETFGDAQAKNRFVLEMNRKADQIGMFDTHFDEPAGYPTTSNQLMSGEDAMRMVIYASDFRLINDIWNKKTKDLTIYGANSRTIPISTTVANSTLEDDCYILGGKTGSIGSGQSQQTTTLVIIVKSKHTGIVYAVGDLNSALNNGKNKFVNVGKVINQIEGRITDAEIDKGSMCVTKLPEFKTSMYSRYPYDLEFDYMKSSQFTPASITKVMSAILLCQYEYDLSKRITLNQSDITSGTGPSFQAGDIITLEDLLYAMMLPSSNTATHAVARYVGNILLRADNNVI